MVKIQYQHDYNARPEDTWFFLSDIRDTRTHSVGRISIGYYDEPDKLVPTIKHALTGTAKLSYSDITQKCTVHMNPSTAFIDGGQWVDHQPIASLDSDGPIEFLLPRSSVPYLPKRLVQCCIDNDTYNGSYAKKPLHAKLNDINFPIVYFEGRQVPANPPNRISSGVYMSGVTSTCSLRPAQCYRTRGTA